jgi:transcriptional accessory protein Tex/SPT6
VYIVANTSGIDINLAVAYPHYSHTLKFVSGLGPRKAQAMLSKILRSVSTFLCRVVNWSAELILFKKIS